MDGLTYEGVFLPCLVFLPSYEEATYGMPGLCRPLTEAELAAKRSLANSSVLSQLNAMVPDEDYYSGEVLFLTSSREAAEEAARAYNGQVILLESGMALLSVASVENALRAAADEQARFPAVHLNLCYGFENPASNGGDLNGGFGGGIALLSAVPQRTTWADFAGGDPFLSDYASTGHHTLQRSISSGYQYALEVVDAYAAWGITEGSGNVTVAVLDSGINASHAELSGKVTALNDTALNDGSNHGTHVAGIIAATRGNHIGGAGVAPGVRLLSYRVTDGSGRISTFSMVSGLKAAREAGAWVINMSLGGPSYDSLVAKEVGECIGAGIPVIAACGNTGSQTMYYPAQYDGVISVAGVDAALSRAPYSTYGAATLSAPGSAILSTRSDGGYESKNGTSMATPVVSGVAALYYSVMGTRDLNGDGNINAGDVDTLIKRLKAGCVRPNGSSSGLGAGVVNIGRMVENVISPPTIRLLNADESEYTGSSSAVPSSAKVQIRTGANGDFFVYTMDGSSPAIRDGEVSNGVACEGDTVLSLGELPAGRVTIRAFSVNAQGKKSAARSFSFTIDNREARQIHISGPAYVARGKTVVYQGIISPVTKSLKCSWRIEPAVNASVTSVGRLTVRAGAKAGDTYTLIASAGDAAAGYEVEVIEPVRALALSLDGENVTGKRLTLNVGETVLLSPTATLTDGSLLTGTGKPGYKTIVSNAARLLAELTDEGVLLTALTPGSAIFTLATTEGSNRQARVIVNVVQPATSIELTNAPQTLAYGRNYVLKGMVRPADATNKIVQWQLLDAPSGVKLSASGVLSIPNRADLAEQTVTARCFAKSQPDVYADCTLTLTIPVTAITLHSDDPKASFNKAGALNGGTLFTDAVNGSCFDEPEENDERRIALTFSVKGPQSVSVRWSTSNAKAATVDENGVVTAVAPGSATIFCTAQDGTNRRAAVLLKVVRPNASITVRPVSVNGSVSYYTTLACGKSASFKAYPSSELGKPTSAAVTWSYELRHYKSGASYLYDMQNSNFYTPVADADARSYIKLSPTGTLSVNKKLENKLPVSGAWFVCVQATAKDGSGAKGSCMVLLTVPTTLLRAMTGTFPIYSDCLPDSEPVEWLTTPTQIPLGSQSHSLYFATDMDVNSSGIALYDLRMTTSNLKVASPQKLKSSFDLYGENRYVRIGREFYPLYSVEVKPDNIGSAAITLAANDGTGKLCSMRVNVYRPVTKVQIETAGQTIAYGKSLVLKASVQPANASNKKVKWSLVTPQKGVTLSSSGRLTIASNASLAGVSVSVRCASVSDPDVSDVCTLEIAPPVISLAISSDDPKAILANSGKLTGGVLYTRAYEGSPYDRVAPNDETRLPLAAQITGPKAAPLQWISSNARVATVDASGLVTGISKGSVTITVKALDGSGRAASVRLTVKTPPVN